MDDTFLHDQILDPDQRILQQPALPFVVVPHKEFIIQVADVGLLAMSAAAIAIGEHDQSRRARLMSMLTSGYTHEAMKLRIRNHLLSTHDQYCNTAMTDEQKDAANTALLNRSTSRLLHVKAGEASLPLPAVLDQDLHTFLTQILAGPPIDKQEFSTRLHRILHTHHIASSNDIILANAWNQYNQLRSSGQAQPIPIRIDRVSLGPRTNFQGNVIDRFSRKYIYGHPWEFVASPILLASAAFIAKRVLTGTAFTLGQSFGVGIAAGALAAARESYDMERERVEMIRQHTLNIPYDTGKSPRRAKLERLLPIQYDAAELERDLEDLSRSINLLNFGTNRDENKRRILSPSSQHLLARIIGIIDISDRHNIDLLRFSDEVHVEEQRYTIDNLLVQIMRGLHAAGTRDGDFTAFLIRTDESRREFQVEILNNLSRHNTGFNKEKLRRSAISFGVMFVGAFALGTTLKLIFDPGSRETVATALHISPSHAPMPTIHYSLHELANGTQVTINASQGIHIIPTGNGSADIILPNGHSIHNAITHGMIDQHVQKQLQSSGYHVTQNTTTVTSPGIPPEVYLQSKGVHELQIVHTDWAISPQDGIDTSLVNLSYTQINPDIITLHIGTSIQGASSGKIGYDMSQIIANGKMFVTFTHTYASSGPHLYAIPVDVHGNATLHATDPLYQTFFHNGIFLGDYMQAEEIGPSGYGVIFGTIHGSGNIPNIPGVTSEVIQLSILHQGVAISSIHGNLPVMAFPPPRVRRPLESTLRQGHQHRQLLGTR